MGITLTEKAIHELKGILEAEGKGNAGLRIWISGGGCSGLSYGMGIDDGEPEAGDEIFEQDGVKIYIDKGSLNYMEGSTVDYVDEGMGGGFKIDNPKAVSGCGCGTSFKTEESPAPSGGGCGGCCHS